MYGGLRRMEMRKCTAGGGARAAGPTPRKKCLALTRVLLAKAADFLRKHSSSRVACPHGTVYLQPVSSL